MLRLVVEPSLKDPLRVLCLGAHSDDIEIGCAGTLMRLLEEHPDATVNWVVLGANNERRAAEARASAEAVLKPAGEKQIIVKGFRDSFFPYIGAEIKEYCETLKNFQPDLILTHTRNDLHQDHRLVCELTHNTFRDHLVLEYEVPKYDGDLGSPNVFVRLDRQTCQKKIEHLREHFGSQNERHWFDDETFWAMLRIRGVESKASSGYAEAFYCRKIQLW
jgi:LmbE family N-acetylglucosaminyl deacetylase